MNKNDRTGHASGTAIHDSYGDGTPFSLEFGVIFSGDWTYKAIQIAMEAVRKVGSAISQALYVNNSISINSGDAFRMAHGNLAFQGVGKNNICDGCTGQTSYPVIKFIIGDITDRLVGHELGHAFDRAIWTRNGSKYTGTNNPVEFLTTHGIYDGEGNLVTGFSRSKGTYTRWNDRIAPNNGFISDSVPGQYHGTDFDDWNDPNEGFADIYLNWAFNTFADNPSGLSMYVWTATNMASWLNSGR